MLSSTFIGIFEIAELEGVSPSAVANWRKRYNDFPRPIADLKSGPVFNKNEIKFWLAKKEAKVKNFPEDEFFYDQLAIKRGDTPELREKIEEVVAQLQYHATSTGHPGILLGKVQSGKTRAFLGVIARAFDRGYDIAVILTKGTKSLAAQTLKRVKIDFEDFIKSDQVDVHDILAVPDLTPYELSRKLIFVVKKEDDNLRHLLDLFQEKYPELKNKSVLIVDDEADLASVSFRRINGKSTPGVISQQIDQLRDLVSASSFLQVTATPYCLYLQPTDDQTDNGDALFKPKRPAFTVLLPIHNEYVGGDEYFEKSAESNSPAYYFYCEVPISERDALKKADGRRLQIDQILNEKNVAVLRDAIVTFLVGGTIRRLQQRMMDRKHRPAKYSFLFHTEQSKNSHEWQEKVTTALKDALISEAEVDSSRFNELLYKAYSDLKKSIELASITLPSFEEVKNAVVNSLKNGEIMITRVNSDKDINSLLDDDGQLKLRTPFNIFIGGQILDRGITINNLIAFYYGRNPQRFQQDTVLQHSRMYGARPKEDCAVTRFYAPLHVYQTMRRIHEYDGALREAFQTGAHDKGVHFIQKDSSNRLIPCSPNKLLYSDVISIRPGRRLVLSGFQTVAKSVGTKKLVELDSRIDAATGNSDEPILISIDDAIEMLELAYANMIFDNTIHDDREAHIAALEYLSRTCRRPDLKGKVWLLTAKNRKMKRYREAGRFSNAPDQILQKDLIRSKAENIPVLMFFRQDGNENDGWRGLSFWWPVILTPRSAATVIFATDEAAHSIAATTTGHRPLSTEEIA